jgi:hypothetical protein
VKQRRASTRTRRLRHKIYYLSFETCSFTPGKPTRL